MLKTGEAGAKKFAEQDRKRPPRVVTVEQAGAESMSPEALRSEISKQVFCAAVRMVNATIELAEQGHYQAMKCLFEMIGLFPAPATPDSPPEDSLAGLLLDRLKMGEEELREKPESSGDHVK